VTPGQLLNQLKTQAPATAYLFLGPESYGRDQCRQALIAKVLPAEERIEGVTRADLDEVTLAQVLDDARSLSLFTRERLIWVANADAVLPRGRSSAADSEDDEGGLSPAHNLAAYMKNPMPGTVIVFDAPGATFDRDGKSKLDRLLKFFAPVTAQVEFRPFDHSEAMRLARELSAQAGLSIGGAELELLVESLDNEAARIAVEIEKLRLFDTGGRPITADDLMLLIPDARVSNIFNLVEALGRKDRTAALETLENLVREGEYLPLALSFLEGQFRFALMAKEAGLRDAHQIQNHFSRGGGPPMFRARAEQVAATASKFNSRQLARAIRATYDADVGFRDARPDDRIVMENLIFSLTSGKAEG